MLQTNNQEQTDENNGGYEDASPNCDYGKWEDTSDCNVKCGSGTKTQLRSSRDPRCTEISQQVDCEAAEPCKNKGSNGIH